MAGPWEAYAPAAPAAPAAAGPWAEYDRRAQPERRAPFVPPAELDVDPSAGMSGGEKFLVGAGAEVDKAMRGLKGLWKGATGQSDQTLSSLVTGQKPVDQGEADAALYQKYRPQGWQTTAGELAGAAGSQAPLALIPGGLAVQIGVQGLGSAAMTPGGLEERAKAGAFGAGGAAGGHVLTKALGRVAKPIGDKADDIKALEALGVQPTFGQGMAATDTALGRSIGRAEEAAQSVPFAGGPLRRTREQAMGQWQQATRDAALPPSARAAGPAGSIDEVFTRIGDAYRGHLDPLPMPYASVQYQPNLRRLSAGIPVTRDQRQLVQDFFDQTRLAHMSNPTPGVQPTAAAAQQIESALKREAAGFMASQDPAQKAQGRLFRALAEEYGNTWRGALPPGVRAAVREIDKVYPNALAIAQAGRTVGMKASGGVPEQYTPAVLNRAARSVDRSPGKRTYLRHEAPQQELSRLGERLTPKVSDSGSPERAASIGLMAGLADIGNLGLLALPALYGTQPVQNYLMGRAAPQAQEQLLRLLRGAAPLGAAAGAGAANYGE